MSEFLCGAILSPKDERDWCMAKSAVKAASLPTEYLPPEPEKKHQQAGSCTGHSSGYACEGIHGIEFGAGYVYGRREDGEYMGEGRTLRSVCEIIAEKGNVPYANYKADLEMPAQRVSVMKSLEKLDSIAKKYRLDGYARLHTVDEIKRARLDGAGVLIAVPTTSTKVGKGNVFKCTKPTLGYHAMCLWGWNAKYARVLNSWGERWGDNGSCWITWDDVLRCDEVFALYGSAAEIKLLKLLKRGSKGVQVDLLQQALQEQGYAITVDADYGAATESAVRQFQASKKMNVTGTVGTRTWRALGL